MNEDEKNDWDRKADEIDQVTQMLLNDAHVAEDHLILSSADYVAILRALSRVRTHCKGLADSHRVNEKTGREGA